MGRSLPRASAWLVVGAVLVVLGTLVVTDHGRAQRDVLYGGIDEQAGNLDDMAVGASTNRRILSRAQMLAHQAAGSAKPAKCTGLMNCVGQAYANKWLAKQGAPWTESSDKGCPGCDGGEDAIPPAPAAGDTSLSAVVQALQRKLAVMRQSFRVIEDKFEHGPARSIDVNINPRGPRGFTGPDGPTGPPGKTGPKGGKGPPGHKGPRGPRGPQGVRGRTGAKGMTGAKGRAGKKGPRGKRGNIGKTGYAGPKGSRGLPGAAGSPGANGKQGIAGPAGRDSGAGAPGPAGFRGPQGFAGKNGKNGKAGSPGPPGQKGKPGRAGPQGNVGHRGSPGVGPPVPTAVQLLGRWPRGGSWTSDMLCKNLGVKDNLGGKCKKLCPRCKDSFGFKLVNSKGLRWGGYTFDDKNIGPGSVQARNICALARYGQGGVVRAQASDESFGTINYGHKRPHWYGNCSPGHGEACCANSQLLKGKINWRKTAHGSSCSGNSHKAGVTKEILCVYDAKGFAKYAQPRKPYAKIFKDRRKLISNGKKAFQRRMRSRNGRYYLKLTSKGIIIIYRRRGNKEMWRSKPDSAVGKGPFSLKIIGNGALAILNGANKVIWARGMGGKWFELGNGGNLKLYGRGRRGRQLVWDRKKLFRQRRPSRKPSNRRSRKRRGWLMRIWTGNKNMRRIPTNYKKYKLRGSRYTHYVNLKNNNEFKSKIKATPHDHFVWEFNGRVRINRSGTYTLCTKSDDGSRIKVDGRLLVNNDGLHGPKEKCGKRYLRRGNHRVITWGFQRGGGAYQTVYYKGPDTRYRKILLNGDGAHYRPKKVRGFKMRVWKGVRGMHRIPSNYRRYRLLGTKYVDYIELFNNKDFTNMIRKTPHDNFVWEFTGKVRIHRSGRYTMCTKSDDGSKLSVNGKELVNNDGLHGPRERCGTKYLRRGSHRVTTWGFQRHGGAYQTVYYKGPDTKGRKRLMRPAGFKGGKRSRRLIRGWKMQIFTGNTNMHRLPRNYQSYHLKGTRWMRIVNIRTNKDFQRKLSSTPHDHFMWEFSGKVRIRNPGRYTICSRSDDGSKVKVDGSWLVNNDGLHGPKTKCGTRSLSAGAHSVVLAGFQRGGGAYQTLTYKGPDTRGKYKYMHSRSLVRRVKRRKSRRGFTMKIWKSKWRHMNRIPKRWRSKRRWYQYIGSRVVGHVNFHNNREFTTMIRKTPHDHFVWSFKGHVRIHRSGTYKFCTRSDDGSRIKIGRKKLVNNDGLHPPRTKCGSIRLRKGKHRVFVWGFQKGGGAYQTFTYKGPDTKQHMKLVPSVDYR